MPKGTLGTPFFLSFFFNVCVRVSVCSHQYISVCVSVVGSFEQREREKEVTLA